MGGSGLIFDVCARNAIHTLNRFCPTEKVPPHYAKPNAIWVFLGHANPFVLGFGKKGGEGHITNYFEAPENQIYNIHNWHIDFVLLAYLHGCGTAGGTVKVDRQQEISCPDREFSIAASFYRQGADAIVGWRDTQYSGLVSYVFHKLFWHALCVERKNVERAIKTAKDHLPWWTRFFRKERDAIMKTEVWGGHVTILPPRFGH